MIIFHLLLNSEIEAPFDFLISMFLNLLGFLSTCIGDKSQPSQSNMSATKAAPQINRNQTRAEVDGQIQKSIPTHLQAALCQCCERLFGKHLLTESHTLRWGDVSLRDDPMIGLDRVCLKYCCSRVYQDYDQEQAEHPLQPVTTRLNRFFAKYVPSEAKNPRSLWHSALWLFVTIVVMILEKLKSCSIPLEALMVISIFMVFLITKIITIIHK